MRFRPIEIVVVVVGFACVLLACEQIIGLDNFKKCAPLGNDVCDASLDGDVDADLDASDAGDASDAFVFPDGVSEASSWARWRMDNPASEVATGAPDASLTRFDAATPQVLIDEVNGNAWCDAPLGKAGTVTDAQAYCASLPAKCRLPTRIELASLLDSTQQKGPFITPAFVAAVVDAGATSLWSSSYVRPVGSEINFWFAELTGGDMRPAPASNNVGVLCIK